MIVAFASLRRWNSDLSLALVTNEPPPDRFCGQLVRLGVEIRTAPFEHRPPVNFARHFAASLYMLDAMVACAQGSTLFLDPDVLCIGGVGNLLEKSRSRVGVLPIPYHEDHDVNGLTRREAGALHALLGEPVQAPEHFGGECYAVPVDAAAPLIERAARAWELSLERFALGASRFTTEEHLLGYALRGVPSVPIDDEIRRIWTAARYRNVDGREQELALWHLPAEKDRGFRRLYSEATEPSSWFWSAPQEEFVARAGKAMGLVRRPPRRLVRDVAGQVLARASR